MGEKIKSLREAKGLTQAQLARRIFVSKATVCAYENGTRQPPYEVLLRLVRQFNITTDYLLVEDAKNEINVDGLTGEQRNIIAELIFSLRKVNSLSPEPEAHPSNDGSHPDNN